MTARDRKRFLIAMALAVAIGALLSLSVIYRFVPGLDGLQNMYDDTVHFKARAEHRAQKTVLVEIDEKSIEALKDTYGRVFSWPRTLHAQVVGNLTNAGARVIVFDILFDAPARDPVEDQVFAQAIADSGRVILAMSGYPAVEGALAEGQPPTYESAIRPRPAFVKGALAIAHSHADPDADGTVRRIPLYVNIGSEEVPALSLLAASKYLNRPVPIDDRGPGWLSVAGRLVPIDTHGKMIINYLGRPSHRTTVIGKGPVPTVSFIDVLNGDFDRELVKDKIAFIGLTALGFADDFWTPTSVAGVKMSGVEIHVNATETILRNAFLQQQSTVTTVLVIMALTIFTGFLLARFPPLGGGILVILVFVIFVFAGVAVVLVSEGAQLRTQTSTMLNVVFPAAGLLVTFIVVMLYRVIFEQAEQRATRRAMGQYLSPAVMDEVMQDPEGLRLGGQKVEMTVLFSDIRGFTSISEKMDPQELVAFLNEYLTAMTEIVFQEDGVLDKYMGDAIMAFWGAPRYQPNHALQACTCGYRMMLRLAELRADWIRRGVPPMDIGIGFNTGPMTVGNVGGEQRFDYTVMGDAVNLGSRLEGVNKEYGTNMIISETTFEHVKDHYRTRYLDLIAVKGKKEPVAIYELFEPLPEGFGEQPSPLRMPAEVEEMAAVGAAAGDGRAAAVAVGERPQLPPSQGYGLAPELVWTFEEGILLYRQQQFAAARAKFQEVLAQEPDDMASQVYVERCNDLEQTPPEPEWDGVFVMTHK